MGHEFRPEYRQLSALRQHFPDLPIAAFTASATRQVRHDIIAQLRLRSPDKYIASFHRPNLRYLVKQWQYGGQGLQGGHTHGPATWFLGRLLEDLEALLRQRGGRS